ncbi:unnamed protein product [Rotaria magnacalcarata]|uniref:Tudor domain-containing protein n=5 Tax=Rotaria magnacalcarata TaxID=392030 RepID=A0A819YE89_9BILA|nr:unnamed protein product [Rotaria magnacalcarata]
MKSLFSRHGFRVTSLLQILIELYICLELKYELIRSFLYLSDLFTSSQQLYDLCYKYFCTWFDEDDVMISLVSYGLCKPNILFRQRTKEYNELYIRLIERVIKRLNKILHDPTFTCVLTLMDYSVDGSISSLPYPMFHRFCSQILPQIHHKIQWLHLELLTMNAILLSANYPNLYGLGLYGLKMQKVTYLFTDETLLYRFKNQISSLVIDIVDSDGANSLEIIRFIFTHLCAMFTNLRYLNFGPSLSKCQQLSFGTSSLEVVSSTISELHICVPCFLDCLYLLDGRFNQLHTLYVYITFIYVPQETINHKAYYILNNIFDSDEKILLISRRTPFPSDISSKAFQIDLQKSIQNLHKVSSLLKYQAVAVQDSRALWHRAIILDGATDLSNVCIYFVDIGHIECISINNIHQPPSKKTIKFRSKPAFAIPCCLYNVCPINGNEQSIWKLDDKVHDEFIRLMINTVDCKVCSRQDQICYHVEIDIPKVGDLGTFLINNNLVSYATINYSQRPNFSLGQPPQQSFVRPQFLSSGIPPSRQQQQHEFYHNPNTMVQQSQTRTVNTRFQNTTAQQSPSALSSIGSSLTIDTVPPDDGYYIITQIRSAAEFYGRSQNRQHEFEVVSKELEQYYNHPDNVQSLTVSALLEGTPCAIEQYDKYYRVIMKRCENGSKVLVKLIDCGDEIVVDTSELLQIDKKFCTITAFVQTFHLHGYDESQNSVHITCNLKKLLLNQWVHITKQGLMLNGRYSVHVTLCDRRSVNQMLLSN